ncbi:MAG: hypothetical protein AAB558_02815 [Patescibacteria group bacterium]
MNQAAEPTQILSKRMVVPLFMFGGFAGGLSLILASIFIPGFFGDGSWVWLLVFGVLGVALIAFGLRPRVARFNSQTREVSIGWGVRWTWVFKTIRPDEWVSLNVEKVFPVVVYPHHVSSLPPRWKLSGVRKNNSTVIFADYPSEQEAVQAKAFFAQQFQLKT